MGMINLEQILGFLYALLVLIAMKVVDLVSSKFLETTIFSRLWKTLKLRIKMVVTRVNPIKISLSFRVRSRDFAENTMKSIVEKVVQSGREENGGRIMFERLTWDQSGLFARTKLTYDQVGFDLMVSTQKAAEFEDMDENHPGSLMFSIETQFAFAEFENMLLSLSSLCGILQRVVSSVLNDSRFSTGMFTISPLKGELSLNDWISENQFQVSLLLKSKEKIYVNFFPNKAQVIFPHFEITGSVAKCLKGVLINYYF